MKPLRLRDLGGLIGGAFLTLAAPSHAAFQGRSYSHSAIANNVRNDRNQMQQDRQLLRDNRMDLNQDQERLREDRRYDASRGEIANDQSDIRQDVARDRHDLQVERRDLRHDIDQEHHSFFDWWHSWWGRR